jgi:Family of unknown function (DUF5681)
MEDDDKEYEVGRGKPPVATRFKKGKSGNPSGKRKEVLEKVDPGKILQSIDNETIVVKIDGKSKTMRKGELYFQQLFTRAIKANLRDARLIASMAAMYFAPEEAGGASETRFWVLKDNKATLLESGSSGKSKGPARAQLVSTGVQFRRVANEQIPFESNGNKGKMSFWDAYMRQIYVMALNKNSSAARLLHTLRKQFPGDLLPGDPINFLISEADAAC